jgi:hypothetical protein
MIVLGFNDHLWKAIYGNWVTGKLSDIAGLIFFPLLLEYLVRSRKIAVLLTGIVFAMLNTIEIFNQQWIAFFQSFYAMLGTTSMATATMDWTDLLVLPILIIPLIVVPKREVEIADEKSI